ncbi:MAG: hypothetical protein HQK67_13160 [Desulfamplus sp.]|nr:hypothetical protein [Desulfamplus sp.]
MICDVLLTRKDKKFIARVFQYPEIVAEDDTEEAVLSATRVKLKKMFSGSRVVRINIEPESCEHPWFKYAGMFSNDSDWEVFQEAIGKYRKEANLNTDIRILETYRH